MKRDDEAALKFVVVVICIACVVAAAIWLAQQW